jgi:hypothetical protein
LTENLAAAKAGHHVIVDHSGGLHMRVTNGRADELKAPLPQVFAQRIRFVAGGSVVF